jgi:hypothetical protein
MTRAIFLSLPLLLASQSVWAASSTTGGHSAVALAGVVASYSPTLPLNEKVVMAKLFDGQDPSFPAGKKITITADSITCFAGDVSINTFNCKLTFGKGSTIDVTGRKANEIYATLIEAGVPGDGAAGKIYESVVQLSCTIDPNEIKQNSGGGASCSFTSN